MEMSMPPKHKEYRDDWGTGAREGYEDRGAFRPPRARQKEAGSPMLRTLGGVCIVGGVCWGTYLATLGPDGLSALQHNHGPVAIVAIGLIGSILGKYIRA